MIQEQVIELPSVMKRDGSIVEFKRNKIAIALQKAFIAVRNSQNLDQKDKNTIEILVQNVIESIVRRKTQTTGATVHIEDIQDQVELSLMRLGEHEIAKAYIIYRQEHARLRAQQKRNIKTPIHIRLKNNVKILLDIEKLFNTIKTACKGFENLTSPEYLLNETLRNIYDGAKEEEVNQSAILAARSMIENEPAYDTVTARLLLNNIRAEVLDQPTSFDEMNYKEYFPKFINKAVKNNLLNPKLPDLFDLEFLASKIDNQRDGNFKYLGLQTLYDRYLLHIEGKRIEMPQALFMRVAMGLAIKEDNKDQRALEFYNLLSNFDFMSSTPTLFNSATKRSQLSSCYISTVEDDLISIYDTIKENALLSKFAGGLGNDWTPIRALGSHIKGTNGKSQGIVPFLKVVNDTAVAVNQGGKRKGAVCSYLESWHLDVEEFLELRKNTGDERRRTHDMNTANWIPDLFMKRVMENSHWTLFSPDEVSDLHDLYGKAFEQRYIHYEELVSKGKIKLSKTISAVSLWRKMLSMLFETGHPWITFKDPCNIRNPQKHKGVVHSSNLCTEITLNTSKEEIAVCNLGSINLVNHLKEDNNIDVEKLKSTVKTAMRMLDNVIDVNFYPVDKAEKANTRHRAVGLGIMGFQDCLHKKRISYASDEALEFADESMELVSYFAIEASSDLALERGKYSSFDGSLWSQGVLPIDSQRLLLEERGSSYTQIDSKTRLDWESLREKVKKQGMRNSNCLTIAPTATIANIVGVSASIEPTYQNLFVKSNLSGEFTVINRYLIEDLKDRGLWDEEMKSDLRYFDGTLSKIERIPPDLRSLYATAFEIDPKCLVRAAAKRQKWIDQSQSLNLYMAQASGKKLDELYKLAWTLGLKTTYYLRSLAASSAEKSTGRGGELNAVSPGSSSDECESCQ